MFAFAVGSFRDVAEQFTEYVWPGINARIVMVPMPLGVVVTSFDSRYPFFSSPRPGAGRFPYLADCRFSPTAKAQVRFRFGTSAPELFGLVVDI